MIATSRRHDTIMVVYSQGESGAVFLAGLGFRAPMKELRVICRIGPCHEAGQNLLHDMEVLTGHRRRRELRPGSESPARPPWCGFLRSRVGIWLVVNPVKHHYAASSLQAVAIAASPVVLPHPCT